MRKTGLVVSAACVLGVVGAPARSWAQDQGANDSRDRVLPEGREAREERYTGGPVPPGAHVETRPNPYLAAAGATLFVVAYLPFAVDGIITAASPPQNAPSWAYTNVYRVIPVVGPIINAFAFDARQRDQCATFMAMPTGQQPSTPWCTDENAGMRDAMGRPLPPNYVPRLASTGEWIFEVSLAVLQTAGIAAFVWGMLAERVVVYPAETTGASAQRTAAARRRAQRTRVGFAPSMAGADAGFTLSGTFF